MSTISSKVLTYLDHFVVSVASGSAGEAERYGRRNKHSIEGRFAQCRVSLYRLTMPPGEGTPHARKRDLKLRVFDEVIKFLKIAVYLWVMFGVFALHESVVSAKDHINYHFYGFALVNALILGKVMLVAEDLHFADWFKDRPLIYPILC